MSHHDHDDDFLGLALEDASELAMSRAMTLRATQIDGRLQIGAADVQSARLNVQLFNGRVVEIDGRG